MHTKRYAPECYARSLASDRRLGRLEQHDAKLTTVLGTTQLELEAVSERCWTGGASRSFGGSGCMQPLVVHLVTDACT